MSCLKPKKKKSGNCDGEGSDVCPSVYRMDKMFYLPKVNKRETAEPSQKTLPKAAKNARKKTYATIGENLQAFKDAGKLHATVKIDALQKEGPLKEELYRNEGKSCKLKYATSKLPVLQKSQPVQPEPADHCPRSSKRHSAAASRSVFLSRFTSGWKKRTSSCHIFSVGHASPKMCSDVIMLSIT